MYWLRVALGSALLAAIASKVWFFVGVVAFAFEGLAPLIELLALVVNWPSLMTGTFPFSHEPNGAVHVDERAFYDVTSVWVNALGWAVLGPLIVRGWNIYKQRQRKDEERDA